MSYFTIVTPTYNRAYCLSRPYLSLVKQEFKDFEWIIIDDGSTDNTEEIVNGFIKENMIKISYYKQINKGRAAALNESYKYITSPYVMNLDSDDELVGDALEKLFETWNKISDMAEERFWCVVGHVQDSRTGKVIGDAWPQILINLLDKSSIKR